MQFLIHFYINRLIFYIWNWKHYLIISVIVTL